MLSVSSSLRSESQAEKYKDLRALLRLLTNICSKDLVSFVLLHPIVCYLTKMLVYIEPMCIEAHLEAYV